MKQLMMIEVKGREKTWSFLFKGDPAHLETWRADGLEVGVVVNTIPTWAVDMGLIKVWFAVQDAWRWLRLF